MCSGRVPKKSTEKVVPKESYDAFEEDFDEHTNKFVVSPIKDGHLLSYSSRNLAVNLCARLVILSMLKGVCPCRENRL